MKAPALPASIGLGIGVAGVAVVALGALAVIAWRNRELVDITSDKNLAASGVNKIGAALTGDKDFSLGSRIYDWTRGDVDLSAPTWIDAIALQMRPGSRTYREGAAPPPVW